MIVEFWVILKEQFFWRNPQTLFIPGTDVTSTIKDDSLSLYDPGFKQLLQLSACISFHGGWSLKYEPPFLAKCPRGISQLDFTGLQHCEVLAQRYLLVCGLFKDSWILFKFSNNIVIYIVMIQFKFAQQMNRNKKRGRPSLVLWPPQQLLQFAEPFWYWDFSAPSFSFYDCILLLVIFYFFVICC